MELSSVKRDVESAEKGVWFQFGEDCSVRIAQWMNKKHAEYLRGLNKKFGRRLRFLSEEEATEVMAKQWEFILTGIKGFTEAGKEIEWSPEFTARIAKDESYSDFLGSVEDISKDALNYREENVKELGEQLPTTQSGPSDGRGKKKDS